MYLTIGNFIEAIFFIFSEIMNSFSLFQKFLRERRRKRALHNDKFEGLRRNDLTEEVIKKTVIY